MWLGFFKECMVSLIFLGISLLSLSITFSWSQLKLWSAYQQCLTISFLQQSQFLTDLLRSSERDFKDCLNIIMWEHNLITNNNNQKLCIFFKSKIKTRCNIFISLSNISAVTFQQPFSKNKVDKIIFYKV